jgi:hypothetical protein
MSAIYCDYEAEVPGVATFFGLWNLGPCLSEPNGLLSQGGVWIRVCTRAFNVFGYVPGVSLVSGFIRTGGSLFVAALGSLPLIRKAYLVDAGRGVAEMLQLGLLLFVVDAIVSVARQCRRSKSS